MFLTEYFCRLNYRYAPRAVSGGVTGSSILALCARSAMSSDAKSNTTGSTRNVTCAFPSATAMANAGTALLAPLLGVALGAHRRLLANELAVVLRATTQLPAGIPPDSPASKISKGVAPPNVMKNAMLSADAAMPLASSTTGTTASSTGAITAEVGPTTKTEAAAETLKYNPHHQEAPLFKSEAMCLPPRPMSSSPSASENSGPFQIRGGFPNEETSAGVGQMRGPRREPGRRHRRIVMATSPAAAAASASKAKTPSMVFAEYASNDSAKPPTAIDKNKSKPLTPAAAYTAQKEAKAEWPTSTGNASPASTQVVSDAFSTRGANGQHSRGGARAPPKWLASDRGLEVKTAMDRVGRLLDPVVAKHGSFGKAKTIQKTKLQGIHLAKIPSRLRSTTVVVPSGAENGPNANGNSSSGREPLGTKGTLMNHSRPNRQQICELYSMNPLHGNPNGHFKKNELLLAHEKHSTPLFQPAPTSLKDLHSDTKLNEPTRKTPLPTPTTIPRRTLLPRLDFPSYSAPFKASNNSHPQTKAQGVPSVLNDHEPTLVAQEAQSQPSYTPAVAARSVSMAPPNLELDVEAVNFEADNAVDQSYEFTDAGTLVTSGFRINVDGVSRAPSRDAQPQRNNFSVPVNGRNETSNSSSNSRRYSESSSDQYNENGIKHNVNGGNEHAKSDTLNQGHNYSNLAAEGQSKEQASVRAVPAASTVNRMEWGRMARGLVYFEELGRGAAGSVRKALYVPELMLVAVKAVPVHEDSRRRQLLR